MKEYKINNLNSKIRYYDISGSDTPILFIHGLGCASSTDYPQIANNTELSGYRKILVDLLGSGLSDKPESFSYSIQDHANYLYDFIKDLDLNNLIIFGHSMGGAIALALSALVEERMLGIILAESNLDDGGGFVSSKIASYDQQDYIEFGHQEIISKSNAANNTVWATELLNSLPIAIYREAQSLVAGQNPSWRNILYSLNIHKSYIFGELSLPDEETNVLKENGVNVEVLDHVGHFMAWEDPVGLSKLINKIIHLFKSSIGKKMKKWGQTHFNLS